MHTQLASLILGGLFGAPIGAAAAGILSYIVLVLSGRRGILAGLTGAIPGVVLGFAGGVEFTHYRAARSVSWGPALAGLGCALVSAAGIGIAALYAGRAFFGWMGVADGMFGERTLRAFLFLSIPLGTLGAMAGYLAGRSLAAAR